MLNHDAKIQLIIWILQAQTHISRMPESKRNINEKENCYYWRV